MSALGYFLIGCAIQIAIGPFWKGFWVSVILGVGLTLVIEADACRHR